MFDALYVADWSEQESDKVWQRDHEINDAYMEAIDPGVWAMRDLMEKEGVSYNLSMHTFGTHELVDLTWDNCHVWTEMKGLPRFVYVESPSGEIFHTLIRE